MDMLCKQSAMIVSSGRHIYSLPGSNREGEQMIPYYSLLVCCIDRSMPLHKEEKAK